MDSKLIPAVFEDGKLCPLVPLDLAEHERVELSVVRSSTAGTPPLKKRVKLPLVPSSEPGSMNLTSERIAEILEEDDLSG